MITIMAVMRNGYTSLISAICAVIVGVGFPEIGSIFKPFSDIFLILISISVIPIIFSSITSSIIKLISGQSKNIKISKIVIWFLTALIIASVIGMLSCYVFNPSQRVFESSFISEMIFQDMQKSILVLPLNQELSTFQSFSFIDFLTTLLPKNPFEAFAKGNVIQILSLSIFVGVAIAKLSKSKQRITLSALSVLMSSFKTILSLPTQILPIGIFFILSSSLSKISIDVLISMKDFCISVSISFLIIVCIGFVIIWLYTPIGLFKSIKVLKESMVIAFSTCSNQATLPFLINALSQKFKLEEEAVDLAIPFGVTMCRTSNASYYAFVVVFIASLYNYPLSMMQCGFIIFGSILASLAASGASGVIAISMISIILDPLNLPVGSILIILVVVEPIMEPFRAVTSLVMNAAISCAVINKDRERA